MFSGVGTRRRRELSNFCGIDACGVLQGVGAGCQNFVGRDRGAGIRRAGDVVSGECVCPGVQATLSVCVMQCAVLLL